MKLNTLLAIVILALSGCASAVKDMAMVTEDVKAVTAMSSDSEYIYMQVLVEKRTETETQTETRWLKTQRALAWSAARSAEVWNYHNQNKTQYPDSIAYDGSEYEIYLGTIYESVGRPSSYATWKLVTEPKQLEALVQVEEIQKKAGSEIDPQSPIFRESPSDLFLFVYPNEAPQIVLLDRDKKQALVIREFKYPSNYTVTESQFTALKALAMPVAKTADTGAVILASPVLIPILLNADFSGK